MTEPPLPAFVPIDPSYLGILLLVLTAHHVRPELARFLRGVADVLDRPSRPKN